MLALSNTNTARTHAHRITHTVCVPISSLQRARNRFLPGGSVVFISFRRASGVCCRSPWRTASLRHGICGSWTHCLTPRPQSGPPCLVGDDERDATDGPLTSQSTSQTQLLQLQRLASNVPLGLPLVHLAGPKQAFSLATLCSPLSNGRLIQSSQAGRTRQCV